MSFTLTDEYRSGETVNRYVYSLFKIWKLWYDDSVKYAMPIVY